MLRIFPFDAALFKPLIMQEGAGLFASPTPTIDLEPKKASLRGFFEATTGFEPVHQGFADPRLTTWLRRPIKK